jgi:hypothetical protein
METSKIVNGRRRKGVVAAALMAVGTVAMATGSGEAATLSVSVPAHAGHAWQPSSANCFSTPSFSNAVQNTCASGQAWLIPISNIPPNSTATRNVTFFVGAKSPAVGAGVPHCRAIGRALNDLNGFIGADTNITTTNTSIGLFSVGATHTLHADCFYPAAPTNQLLNFRAEWFQSAFGTP